MTWMTTPWGLNTSSNFIKPLINRNQFTKLDSFFQKAMNTFKSDEMHCIESVYLVFHFQIESVC